MRVRLNFMLGALCLSLSVFMMPSGTYLPVAQAGEAAPPTASATASSADSPPPSGDGSAAPSPTDPASSQTSESPTGPLSPGNSQTASTDLSSSPSTLDPAGDPTHDVPALRTKDSTAFVDADGSIQRTIYQDPVNYRADDGSWQPIDSTLVDTAKPGYAATNAANDFQVLIPDDIDTKPVQVSDDSSWVTFTPEAADGSPDLSDNTAVFDGPGSSSFDYQVEPTGLKETIHLDQAPTSAPTYRYALNLSAGLTPALDDQGNVVISGSDGTVAYTIPAPVMFDSASTPSVSSSVTSHLDPTDTGWSLTISPDEDWLQNTSRVYPVSIDPTLDLEDSSGTRYDDCWIGAQKPDTTNCSPATNYMWAGVDTNNRARRGLIQFDLHDIPADATISSAQLQLRVDYSASTGALGPVTYVARRIIPTWSDTSVTWNRANTSNLWASPGLKAGTDFADTSPQDSAPVTIPSSRAGSDWVPFDVTDFVTAWHSGTANEGMLIREAGQDTDVQDAAFVSAGQTSSPYKPKLYVTYDEAPSTPGSLGVSPCLGPCSAATTATLTPTLTATSTDPDTPGDTLKYTFTVKTAGGTQVKTPSPIVSAVAGTPASWTVPSGYLADGSNYQYTVSVTDGTRSGGTSAAYPFTVNLPPGTPGSLGVSSCIGSCSPATTSTLTPTLSATSTGSAGESLKYTFTVTGPAPGGGTMTVATSPVVSAPAGTAATWPLPSGKLVDLTNYQFSVSVTDSTNPPKTSVTPYPFATNLPPSTPASLGVMPCSGTCSPPSTATLTPTLSTTATDPSGQSLNYTFTVTATPSGTIVATGSVGEPSGTAATWQVPSGKLSDRSDYQYTVSVTDGTNPAKTSAAYAFSTKLDLPPAVPTGFTETPCKPELCAGAVPAGTNPTVSSVSPTLSANLSDPDTPMSGLYGDFQVRTAGDTQDPALATGAQQPDGTGLVSFTVPAGLLTDGGHYEFRVGDRDGTPADEAWSDWIPFDVVLDATVPTVAMSPCLAACTTWVTDTTVPSFTALAGDSDGSPLTYHFDIQKPDGTEVTSGKVTGATPGQTTSWKTSVGALSIGSYRIRVGAAKDSQGTDDAIQWSDFTAFQVQYPTPMPTESDENCSSHITTHVIWTQANSPHVLNCLLIVSSGGDLEIQPGAVVKLGQNGLIDVQGGELDAHGSSAYPIFFTSLADDSELGDTNGDGSTTGPAPGDWTTAVLIGDTLNATVGADAPTSTISNAVFEYGGRGSCTDNNAVQVLQYGRAVIAHDDFRQLQCNAVTVNDQSGSGGSEPPEGGIGSAVIRNNYFESTVANALNNTYSGVIKNNVFASASTLINLGGQPQLSMTGNYIGGTIRLNITGSITADGLGLHDNSMVLGSATAVEPTGSHDPMDLRDNWWGYVPGPVPAAKNSDGTPATTGGKPVGCAVPSIPAIADGIPNFWCTSPKMSVVLPPNQGYVNQVLPALASPPPFPDAGLESAPASLAIIDAQEQFGNGSEFAQRASGDQADPVNSADGSYTESDVDATVANVGYPMIDHRTYNSLDTSAGSLGQGWSWDYDAHLTFPDDSHTTYIAGDGQRVKYTLTNNTWAGDPGVTAALTAISGGGYQILTRDNVTYTFNSNGVLQSILDRNGQGVTLTHTSGQVTQAASSGRTITFTYNATGLLKTATLDDGRYVDYDYNSSGLLTHVTDLTSQAQSSIGTTYTYDSQGRLETETNAAGTQTMKLAYDPTTGRVSDQWDADLNHTSFAWDPVEQVATETDPNGGNWIDDYNDGALFARVDPNGRCSFYDFNKNLQLTDMVDPRGNESTYAYDDQGDLKATRDQTGRSPRPTTTGTTRSTPLTAKAPHFTTTTTPTATSPRSPRPLTSLVPTEPRTSWTNS